MQVNFTFDSIDGAFNDFAGWHIDDFALYTSGTDIVVGEAPTGAGSSVYSMDLSGTSNEITGMNTISFNDIAAGSTGATFLAVGDSGAAEYWNNSAWSSLTGIDPLDTLTGIDCNGTHFFIVGYDSANQGVSYYITQNELDHEFYAVHVIRGAPDIKLNGVSWSNNTEMGNGEKGLGLVVGEGGLYGLMDPEIWVNETSTVAPSPRYGQAMAFDSKNHVTIMFGGTDAGGYNDETWAYSTETNTWTNMSPVSKPSGRRFQTMVYDETNEVIVLFGGYNGGFNDETWTYDYGTNTWTNMNPTAPPGRCYHSMVYDSDNSEIVMFGGAISGGIPQQDTWTYNVTTNTWIDKSAITPPTARTSFDMVYDKVEKKVVLFGGLAPGYNGETWTYDYDTNTWTNEGPVSPPLARCEHSMVYNADEQKVMMYGGRDGTGSKFDSWTYDVATNSWYNLFPSARPNPRVLFSMAYDPDYNQIIMFGGDAGNYNNETWLCDLH